MLQILRKQLKQGRNILKLFRSLEKKALIFDVLTPIGYNFMVTPKEVDFTLLKLVDLISLGINEGLHNI